MPAQRVLLSLNTILEIVFQILKQKHWIYCTDLVALVQRLKELAYLLFLRKNISESQGQFVEYIVEHVYNHTRIIQLWRFIQKLHYISTH